ncbi:SPX-domain-containing protein [Gigaspora margarita]|uniref:SPX-domain-containing protein n=1 Tax=Gigaspora margarita TaxID=4874 RepID=A0A8H4AK28_GIGMA|nr:SPX-domain-containing protein [Gigaspora margarita]
MSGSKRKTRSLERDIEEEPVTWKSFIKTLEKPNVPNRLLEYLCSLKRKTLLVSKKQETHRKWIDTISNIWKKHPSARIQKLAKKSVDNYKKEKKSKAVVNFWKNIDDLQNKARLGEELFMIHFEGFSDMVRNRSNKIIHELEDSDETVSSSGSDSEKDDDSEEAHYAHIIDLDNVANQMKPPFCSDGEWSSITSVTQISIELPRPVEEQLGFYLKEPDIKKIRASFKSYTKTTPFTDVDEYTRRVFDYFLFCLETRPEYFSQRPANESTFRARFIEPIIKPFVFIFKDLMDLTWDEISSTSSATRRNFQLTEGKRRRIGSKTDDIGSLVSIDDKELLIFELSGAPSRLPVRHSGDDQIKLDGCLVGVLNNLLEEFKECSFELAKNLKVFGFQTEGFNCTISVVEIVGRGIYRRRTLSRFCLPTRVQDLYYLYDLFKTMLGFRNELAASLDIIQELKIAKTRKLQVEDPVGDYMLRLPPS